MNDIIDNEEKIDDDLKYSDINDIFEYVEFDQYKLIINRDLGYINAS